MRLNEILNHNSGFLTNAAEIIGWLHDNTAVWAEDIHVNSDGTVDISKELRLNRYVEELPIQLGKIDGNLIFPMDSKIKNAKGFPLECDMIDLDGCQHITSLEGIVTRKCYALHLSGTKFSKLEDILPHLKFPIIDLNIENTKIYSLSNIDKMAPSLETIRITAGENDFSGLLSLVLLPKLSRIMYSTIFNRSSAEEKHQGDAIDIIRKYIGSPDDLFTCQAELIDNGLEKFAEI